MEGALEDAVEAGLVAVGELDTGLAAGAGKGGGDAGDLGAGRIGIGLRGHGGIDEAGFDGPGAALAPERGDHFLDEAEFDGVGGSEADEEIGKDGVEALARLVIEDDAHGEQPMADVVLRRSGGPGSA